MADYSPEIERYIHWRYGLEPAAESMQKAAPDMSDLDGKILSKSLPIFQ